MSAGTDDPATIGGLLLLGCGKMGGALLSGWLAKGLPPERVQVIDPHPSDWLRDLATRGLVLNPASPGPAEVAVLAVKPQMMDEAAPAIAALGGGGTLVISIAAGTPIAEFERIFGPGTPVVRAMPNTPSAIGKGVSALIANTQASGADRARAEGLMAAVGRTVWLEGEGQMEAVTGLSGSGPAYVFHMIEAMASAGEAEGLDPDLAMTLARSTVIGAAALAEHSEESAEQLRINVTSPGGTTAAGLGVLMEELPDLMRRTVGAAAARFRGG